MALYFPTNFIETTEDPYCAMDIPTFLTSTGFLTGKLFPFTLGPVAITIVPALAPSSLYPNT